MIVVKKGRINSQGAKQRTACSAHAQDHAVSGETPDLRVSGAFGAHESP